MYSILTEDDVNSKLVGFAVHESQVVNSKYHPRNLDTIRQWAIFRGLEVQEAFAEKFYLVRLVV